MPGTHLVSYLWGCECAFDSFAAHLSARLRSLLSVIVSTSSMQSTQRWWPALSTPSLLTWPGNTNIELPPSKFPVIAKYNMSKFPSIQDQYSQKTGWTWTDENPPAVRSDSPDFKRLRSVSGGPGTHTEVRFQFYTSDFFVRYTEEVILWMDQ